MCGIVGVFARDGSAVDPGRVAELRDLMRHRGPDDEGLWQAPSTDVVLGHRRLSIIDLSAAGRAPMGNEDGTVQVTFNGEIYNHAELRDQLVSRGHRFRSHCDTEVLVHLYEEHGQSMVQHLVGMFAFAIWDQREERLFLARDRLGIKPLYWTSQGRTFAFASEIKALVPLLARREVDPVALSHYLTFVAVPPPRTLFAGVQKLPPGHTMTIDRSGSHGTRRYWDPLEERAQLDLAPDEWAGELLTRLERSVRRRMMSDVPVGVFLSGGVDSSTNVALMRRLGVEHVKTFSVGFRDQRQHNEFSWARQVAREHVTQHHEVEIDQSDLVGFLPDLVFHQDEPIADPVCVPLYFVAKLAKEHGVTVAHVGEGSDEIFAGYPTYVRAQQVAARHWPALRALPRPLRRALAGATRPLEQLRPGQNIEFEALHRAAQADGRLWWGGAVAFYERAFESITTPGFRGDLNGSRPRDVVAEIDADATRFGARDDLDRIIYQDLRLRLPELLLMRVDKLTMASSVEARVPFLDHELVEFAMAVPSEEKVHEGVGKHLLKRSVEDLLPREIVWRPKQGFSTPVSEWFRSDLSTQLEAQMRASAINELGWIDQGAVADLLALHRSGKADRSFQLWNILNLSAWFDHWIARVDVQAA